MEPTFQIKYRLEKQANRSQSIMNSGFGETSGENRSTLSSILEKSFKNIFPELKKVDHKIKNLFSLLSKEDFSSTIILKSSFSKSFKSIMRFEGKKYFARNLAIIINVDNDEIISQLNGKNRVILTLDVYSENNSDQRIVYFDLDNIHFINETFKYTNPEIALEISSRDLKLLKTNEVPTTVDMVNSQLLLEIKKSGSIFESDNKLKISEWREHVHTMYNYLDSQRSDSESYHIFFHDDVTIKHDVNTKISIVSKGKTDFPNRMIILNDNDFGMSIPVLLNKPKKVNYFKSIKENQESAMKNLDLTQNEINSLLIKNKKEKEKINNALTKKKEEDNEKDSWIRKKEKFNQSTQKFKADLKKLEEIKNIKIHKKDLIQITKDQLHQIQYVKNQINVIKNKVQKIDNSISKCSTTLSKLESEIYIYKKESKRISSHIKDLLNDQNKYQLKIEKYKKAMDIIQSKNYVFYEVIGTFEFRVDKNKKYNAIGMNVVKFLNDDEKTEKWSISEFDLGTLSKYKRFDTALRGMMFGQFKSPYMMSSLENPIIPVRVSKKAKSKILLNTLQRKAVNVSLNSHFASYLQGPPGTGKTQCISVIIENFAKENEISLISSSTNEAINNVFDRVKNDNIDPNLIYLRQTSSNENKKKVLNYSEEFMTFNIIDQMDNFVLKKSKSGNQELIQKFIKEYPMENGKPIKYITQLVKKKYNYLDPIEANIKKISKFLGESEERLHNMDSRHIHEEVQWEINKIIRKAKRFYGEYFDSLEEFLRQNDIKYDLNDSILEVLKVHISEPKTSKFFKAIKELNSKTFQENIFKSKFDLKTREIIAENKMVNIIGITTTARMVIKISDKKFDLFSQYPVNFAVIDEVSKSITPEILAISMLSDRFLYSGDYRQLPPFMDLDDRIIKKYLSYLIENYEGEETQDWDIKHIQKIFETSEMDVDLVEKTKQLDSSKIQEDEDFDSMFVKLKTHLEKLYGNSIFANQVESMKASPKLSTSSYTALTHQYRFCEEINKIVNIFYEKKEALVTSSQNFNRIFVGKNKDHSPVQIIDTSYITKDFASKVKDKIIVEGMTSFDQVESLFSSCIGNSRFNEFNIHTIEKLLLDIKANNPKIQNEDIGVISMTRTQANLTNQKLLPNPTLKGIKIDTVDNFQGRQKDLIIVDLVLGQSKYISKGKMQTGKRNTSFYKNPERLNVAISRAKSKLILVGAFEDYIAENIISDIKNNGNVRSIKVFKKWKEMIEGWNDDN